MSCFHSRWGGLHAAKPEGNLLMWEEHSSQAPFPGSRSIERIKCSSHRSWCWARRSWEGRAQNQVCLWCVPSRSTAASCHLTTVWPLGPDKGVQDRSRTQARLNTALKICKTPTRYLGKRTFLKRKSIWNQVSLPKGKGVYAIYTYMYIYIYIKLWRYKWMDFST